MDNKLVKSFTETIMSDEALSLAKEYGQMALESLIEDESLKHIPILGMLVSLYKIGGSLKERQTLKKIAVFLGRLSDVTVEEKDEFLNKLTFDDKYKETVFEKVLLLLERLDETSKAEITGNLFVLYVKGVISQERFFRLAGIVERAHLYDLMVLHAHYDDFLEDRHSLTQIYRRQEETNSLFFSLGIAKQSPNLKGHQSPSNHEGLSFEREAKYEVNDLGRKLANFMFCDFANPKFQTYMKEQSKHVDMYLSTRTK